MVLKRVFKLLVNSSILVWGFLSLLVTSFEQKFSDAASDNDCLIGQSCEVGVVNAEKAKCGLFHRDCASMDRVEEQPAYASRKTSAEMQREVAWGEASVWDGDTMTTNSQISRHLDKSHRFLRSVWQRAPCVLPRWAPHIKNGVTRSCKSPIGCNMQPWHPLYLGASQVFTAEQDPHTTAELTAPTWPPNSPAPNPIKHSWDVTDQIQSPPNLPSNTEPDNRRKSSEVQAARGHRGR